MTFCNPSKIVSDLSFNLTMLVRTEQQQKVAFFCCVIQVDEKSIQESKPQHTKSDTHSSVGGGSWHPGKSSSEMAQFCSGAAGTVPLPISVVASGTACTWAWAQGPPASSRPSGLGHTHSWAWGLAGIPGHRAGCQAGRPRVGAAAPGPPGQ